MNAAPHPGTDSILRLGAAALSRAGVRPGDLLAATEASTTLVRVRCAPAYVAEVVAVGPDAAHGEGHLTVVPQQRSGR